MDQLKINLPCGFETTYGCLKKIDEKKMKCTMCEKEHLIVESVLNLPANKLRLKEKQIELETVKLKNLEDEVSTIRKEPRLCVEKSFERVLNDLELRKKDFEKMLNDHYNNLRKNLERQKELIIKNLGDSLNESTRKFEKPVIDENANVAEKISALETTLEDIVQNSDQMNKLIQSTKIGEYRKLIFCDADLINFKRTFGDIVSDDPQFDYKIKHIVNSHFDSDKVFCMANAYKNRVLCGNGKTIYLFDLMAKKSLKIFEGHSSNVFFLCILPNDIFASGSQDGIIKIWSIENGKCLRTFLGHRGEVLDLKLFSNGQLSSCSFDKTIKFWDYTTGQCLQTLNLQNVYSTTILEGENNTIISALSDYSITFRNKQTGEVLKTLKGHNETIYFMKLIDSNRLITGSYDYTVKIWDWKSERCIKTFTGYTEFPGPLEVLKSGHLVTGSVDGTVKIWDIYLGVYLKTININEAINILFLNENEDLVFITDEARIVMASKS
ncbi:unnamed protein product [Brachionus calyciflorus]|uniref:Uncharacterized protein n=1 Tax=Brachionus calyciflorus TaxID=104777 RepID=A0A813YFM4_9BILA|nr:unnamed protein product [Brachionus calyciflorus]